MSDPLDKQVKDLRLRLSQITLQLEEERSLNAEKTAMMEKTIAETERLSLYLQNTTFALMQERQAAQDLAQREKVLSQWIEKVNSSLNITFIVKYLTQEIAKYLKVNRCGIIFLQGTKFQIIEFCEDDNSRTLEYGLLKTDKYFFEILNNKEVVIDEDVKANDLDHFLRNVNSFLSVPLILRKEILGLIYVQSCNKPRSWRENEIHLLQSISFPLVTAIERARLFKKSHERTKQAELLNSLTTQIRSSLNLNEILSSSVNELGFALKVSRCFLHANNKIQEEYTAQGIDKLSNISHELILDKLSSDRESIKTIVVEDLLVPDLLTKLDNSEKFALLESNARSAIATPLLSQGVNKGWIVFHSIFPRIWGEDEISFIESAASQVVVAITQSEIYEKLNSYQERISRELMHAAQVQNSLLGGDLDNISSNISILYNPHSNVSGDFYWITELSPNVVGILIGDVSGKGPAAALVTGYILGQFNSIIENSVIAWKPEKVLNALCESLLSVGNLSDFYATAWYGVMDLTNSTLSYANAGHLFPYISSENGIKILNASCSTAGVPLGLINPREIDEYYSPCTVDLDPNDRLVLFTDGIFDTKFNIEKPDNNWLYEKLDSIKNMEFDDFSKSLEKSIQDLPLNSGEYEIDDKLVLCIENSSFELFEVNMVNYQNCEELIQVIIDQCSYHNLPDQSALILRLGLTEAFANIALYGVKASNNPVVEVGFIIKEGTLKLVILDKGPGFNWMRHKSANIEEIDPDSEGGRGIPLLKEIFDKITWNTEGNHLGLFFYW